jgi:hypothetical protein
LGYSKSRGHGDKARISITKKFRSAPDIRNERFLETTKKGTTTMRNIIAIAAALGFLATVSAPSFAATSLPSIDISAAKKKVDCKDPMNKDNKACMAKMKKTDLTATEFSAAKKKVDCKDPANKDNKACMAKMKK